jgi:hypothetical protein
MGVTKSLVKMPAILVALSIGLCVGLSSLGVVWWAGPKARSLMTTAISHYDAYLPEITIQDGKASIKKPQPYYVDFGQKSEPLVVIDTREGHDNDALTYLKDVKTGFVLTRDTIVTKNDGQIRVIPLKEMRDLVLNSQSLQSLADTYWPAFEKVSAGAAVTYFVFAKPFQVLILALIPYGWARAARAALTYGQAFKIAAFCMIPPVLVNLFQDVSGIQFSGRPWIYFAVYVALLVLASLEFTRGSRSAPDASTEITP